VMGDKIDSQRAELIQRQDHLLHAPSESIKPPHHHHVESAAPGVQHQSVQTGPSFLRTAGSVRIDAVNRLPLWATSSREGLLLNSRILIERESVTVFSPASYTDTNVDTGAFHLTGVSRTRRVAHGRTRDRM
jgi:hypothetical protein